MKKTVKELMENYDKVEAKEERKLEKLKEDVDTILTSLEGQDNQYNMILLASSISIYMAMISQNDQKFHAHLMKNVIETMMETYIKGEEL